MNRSYPFKLPQLLLLTNLVVINYPNANIADYIPENVRAFGKGCSNKLSKLKTSTSNYVGKKVQESPRLQRARDYAHKQSDKLNENVVKPITRRFTWPNIHSNKDNPQQKQDVDSLQRKSFGNLHQEFAPPEVASVSSSTPASPAPQRVQRTNSSLDAASLLAKSLAGDYNNHQKSDSSDSEFEDEVAHVILPPIKLRPSTLELVDLGIIQVTQEPRVSPKLSREDSSQISEKRLAREALAQASNSQVPLIPLPTSQNNGAPLADKKATLEASGSVIIHEDPPVSRSHKQSKSMTELPDMPSLHFAQKKTLTRSASLNLSDLENDMKELEGLSQNLRTEIAGIDKKLEPPAVGTQSLPNSPFGHPENILVPPNSPLAEVRRTRTESASRPGLNMEALRKAIEENEKGLRAKTPPPSRKKKPMEGIPNLVKSLTRRGSIDVSRDNSPLGSSRRSSLDNPNPQDAAKSVTPELNKAYSGTFKDLVVGTNPQSKFLLRNKDGVTDEWLKGYIEETTKGDPFNRKLSSNTIQFIDVSNNPVTEAIIPLLDEKLPKLTHLDLSGTKVRFVPEWLPMKQLANSYRNKPYFNFVTELHLNNLNMQDKHLAYMAQALGNNISSLYLQNNNIRDVNGLIQYKPNIVRLYLSHNKLDTLSIRSLITKMPKLKYLDISNNNLGEKLLTLLMSMDISTIKLDSLDISNNGLTEEQENNIKNLFVNHNTTIISTKDRLESNS